MAYSKVELTPEIVCDIETRGGNYLVIQYDTDHYEIHRDGVSAHGYCTARDVIAWMSNALHSAEYSLMKQEELAKKSG